MSRENTPERSWREFVGTNTGNGRKTFALAKTDEMILPRDEFAGRVDAAFEIVIAERAIVVVVENRLRESREV